MGILERSKAKDILVVLCDGPKNIRELQTSVGGSATTIQERVKELMEEKLIDEEAWDRWPFKRILKLTKKGEETAKLLRIMRNLFVYKQQKSRVPTEREKWILALLHVFGEVKGSTKLEKLLFLLKKKLGQDARLFYEFTPFKFGPFSADVLEDASSLDEAGLVGIREEVLEPKEDIEDWIIRKNYKLSPAGERYAQEIYTGLPDKVKRALTSLDRFNKMTLSELLCYVYTAYPKESRQKPRHVLSK